MKTLKIIPQENGFLASIQGSPFSFELSTTLKNQKSPLLPGTFICVERKMDCGIRNIDETLILQSPTEEIHFITFNNSPGFAYRRIIHAKKKNIEICQIEESIKIEKQSPICVDSNTCTFHAGNPTLSSQNCLPLSNDNSEMSQSSAQSFPAIIYTNTAHDFILIEGTLTQEKYLRHYSFANNAILWKQKPKNTSTVLITKEKSFIGEWNYIEIANSADLNHPYENFLKSLENFPLQFRGEKGINRFEMVWNSPNSNEKNILDNAKFLKNHFPSIKWLQIAYSAKKQSSKNLKSLTKKIKKLSLKPAIRIQDEGEVLQDWGFEAIKQDKFNTEEHQQQQRKLLANHGYLQAAEEASMSNIHLGQYFDNYHCATNAETANWHQLKHNAFLMTFCLNTKSGHLFTPNSGSIKLSSKLKTIEIKSAINFSLISRSFIEISGNIYTKKQHSLMPYLIKASCCPNNGEDVYFNNHNFKNDSAPSAIYYTRTPYFSLEIGRHYMPLRTAAIFNWSDQEKEFDLTGASFGLSATSDYICQDFWSSKSFELPLKKTITLKPHASLLFTISQKSSKPIILDSNRKLTHTYLDNNHFLAEFEGIGTTSLTCNREPQFITVNEKRVDYTSFGKQTHQITFPNKEDGSLKIYF